jgi:hypothetical protein
MAEQRDDEGSPPAAAAADARAESRVEGRSVVEGRPASPAGGPGSASQGKRGSPLRGIRQRILSVATGTTAGIDEDVDPVEPERPAPRPSAPSAEPSERERSRGASGRRILGEAREVVGAVFEGGNAARTEIVKAVAREVRTYLEELGLKEDLRALLTNYSLELKLSLNLRRLAESEKEPPKAG